MGRPRSGRRHDRNRSRSGRRKRRRRCNIRTPCKMNTLFNKRLATICSPVARKFNFNVSHGARPGSHSRSKSREGGLVKTDWPPRAKNAKIGVLCLRPFPSPCGHPLRKRQPDPKLSAKHGDGRRSRIFREFLRGISGGGAEGKPRVVGRAPCE
jgi:hypothetical protein